MTLELNGESITNDEELAEVVEGAIGDLEDLKSPIGPEQDWQKALEIADDLQDKVNNIHAFIKERADV